MKTHTPHSLIASLLTLFIAAGALAQSKKPPKVSEPKNDMSFFVTSIGSGKGGNLGGLPGADSHCQALAQAAGSKYRNWRAYLSTYPVAGAPAVNARDRIGSGPWYNAKGALIARNIDELHSSNNINKATALTEQGAVINGRGDTPNRHEMLTGSQADGRAFRGENDTTCSNWINDMAGSAIVGHHDRIGLQDDAPSKSWNSSHPTKGCSQEALVSTGGDGLFYCFAIK